MTSPRVFLLDGASGAGKTSLSFLVSDMREDTEFVPRYTTRPRRADSDEREYLFLTPQEFDQHIEHDDFIEYKHYEFGMSYGLPRQLLQSVLDRGKHALAIINLGNVEAAIKSLPTAITILINVPHDTLRERLHQRSTHNDDQIEERLRNARLVDNLYGFYDHVVENSGDLHDAAVSVSELIAKYNEDD